MLDPFDSRDVMDMSELDFERSMPGLGGGDGNVSPFEDSAITDDVIMRHRKGQLMMRRLDRGRLRHPVNVPSR